MLERHIHHLVHGTDNVDSQLFCDVESACEALSAAVESDRVLSSCYCAHTASNLPKDICESLCEKQKRRTSSVSKKDSCLKTSADSGYMGCEDRSPTILVNEGGALTDNHNSGSKDQHFAFVDKKPPPYVNRNMKALNNGDEFCMADNEKRPFSDDSSKYLVHGKINLEDNHTVTATANANAITTSTSTADTVQNKKHASMYDNVTPDREVVKDEEEGEKRKQKSDSNFHRELNLHCQMLSEFVDRQQNNEAICEKEKGKNDHPIQNGDGNKMCLARGYSSMTRKSDANNLDCAINREEEDSSGDRMKLPVKVMRNLKWIKLDESVVGELQIFDYFFSCK